MKYQGFEEEQVWLEDARDGNKDAFGKLIDAYQTPVFNLAYRMLSNADEAEQAAQEAFIRAWTRLDSYTRSISSAPGCSLSHRTIVLT